MSPHTAKRLIDSHFDGLDSYIARIQANAQADGIIRDPRSRTRASDGIQRGNADLSGQGTWTGTPEPQPTPLPGHEHQGPDSQIEPLHPGDPDPFLPWLTENRTLSLCGLLMLAGIALRLIGA